MRYLRIPQRDQRHSGQMPQGVRVEDPQERREVQQLQRHGRGNQRVCKGAFPRVRRLPELPSRPRQPTAHMDATCKPGKERIESRDSEDESSCNNHDHYALCSFDRTWVEEKNSWRVRMCVLVVLVSSNRSSLPLLEIFARIIYPFGQEQTLQIWRYRHALE